MERNESHEVISPGPAETPEKDEQHAAVRTNAPILAALLILLTCLLLSYARNIPWHNEVGLWADAAVKSPAKARTRFLLGHAYRRTDPDRALEHFLVAATLDPADSDVYNNLGAIYNEKGQPDPAIDYFLLALKLNPENLNTRFNLATAYMKKGLVVDARREFEFVLQQNPGDAEARKYLDSLPGPGPKASPPRE